MSEPLSREKVEMIAGKISNEYTWKHEVNYWLQTDAAQRARIAALEQENANLRTSNVANVSECVSLTNKLSKAAAERDRLLEALRGATVSLVAAIALLERGGIAAKRAAPSNKMFDQMLRDYKKSVKIAQAALRGKGG